MEAPQIANRSSTIVAIRWTNQHEGDGPICGYEINIKKNDDDDDDSDPWLSVGFVSVESELQFDVGHLEAITTYQVAVSAINCISAREGPREPILQFTTTDVTLPVVEVRTTGDYCKWTLSAGVPIIVVVALLLILACILGIRHYRSKREDSVKDRYTPTMPTHSSNLWTASAPSNVYAIGNDNDEHPYEDIGQMALTDGTEKG
ncbi:uncharacterized protein LOC115927425 [Strongylocentrotus purpuratus]|uniref:Fibronectin type-III domain-containing protein n=1 Tax=Strongylocentrotus purpuratus TaxID=7668 RepID=A0A7M7T2K2_STRPU|nr:uncharacterized protein LOC115927425 [Strongylocentrotus purpuratus]